MIIYEIIGAIVVVGFIALGVIKFLEIQARKVGDKDVK